MEERPANSPLPIYDRALLLHGCKSNEVLSLAEIEQYGLDSFGDADCVSIYGMPPRGWYRHGIRLLGRTAVECTRDALGDRIGLDVASVAARMPINQLVVIDPFAGSCNTLFWILRHLANSEGVAFESDPQVFELTHRNLGALGQRIELIHGDYVRLLEHCRVPDDRGIVAFIAPPWGTALDEVQGLDLRRTAPPISEVIEQLAWRFATHKMLFATQVYERVSAPSLSQVQTRLDSTELRLYEINEKGRNHGSGNERVDTDALTRVSYLSFWVCGPRNPMKIARSNHVRCFSAFLLHQRDSRRSKICLRSRLAVGKTTSENICSRDPNCWFVQCGVGWSWTPPLSGDGSLNGRPHFLWTCVLGGQVSRKTAQVRQYFDN